MTQEQLNKELMQVITKRNKNLVINALNRGANINATDEEGYTPLLLLLSYSSSKESNEIIEYLIENGANVNAVTEFGETPLHIASKVYMKVNLNIYESLIKHGADVNARCKEDGATPLCIVARYPDDGYPEAAIKIIELLTNNGAKINEVDNNGATPLSIFIQTYDDMSVHKRDFKKEVVDYLIKRGADVNLRQKDGTTALWHAAKLGDDDIVEILLDHGADPKIPDNNNKTPVDVADGYIIGLTDPETYFKPLSFYDPKPNRENEQSKKLDEALKNLNKEAMELERLSQQDRPKYGKKAQVAKDLYDNLKKHTDTYFNNAENVDNYNQFKTDSLKAIDRARPALANRSFTKILGNIVLAIVGLGVFYAAACLINRRRTGNFTFFNSSIEQSVNSVEKRVNAIKGP